MCDEVKTFMVVGSSTDLDDVIGRDNIVTSSRSSLHDLLPVTRDRGQKGKAFPFPTTENGAAVLTELKEKTLRDPDADCCIKGKASIAFVRTRMLLVGQKPEPTFLLLGGADRLRRCLLRGWSYEG